MARVYAESWQRIKQNLFQLQEDWRKARAAGEDVNTNWYYKTLRQMELREQISRELNKFAQYAEGIITQEEAEAIQAASEEAYDLLQLELGPRPAGVEIRLNRINPKAVETMVGMEQADSPLHQLLSSIAPNGAQAAEDALTEGILLGWNPRKTAPLIRDALGAQLTRALTIARTETLRAYRTAAQQTYRENADVVKGWTWQAALDDRTCPSCFAQHGSEHPLDEDFGSHPNCRCSPVPETYSWEEIGTRYGIDLSDLDEDDESWEETAKKYFKDGKPNELQQKWLEQTRLRTMKGEEAFKTLSEPEQRKILGPAKWLAWKEGKFEFSQLSKPTWSAEWGKGQKTASLSELLGEEEAHYYKKLVWNGLAKQNLSADELIKFASLDLRPLQEKEISKIVKHVAERGFDNIHLEKAGGRLSGVEWEGKILKGSDRIDSGIAHYLKHRSEWPEGTTLEEYFASIKNVVLDPKTKIFVSRYSGELQAGFVRSALSYGGEKSSGTILIEYRVKIGRFVTANQGLTLDDIINAENRKGFLWVRK